jgi:hypothetical protein
VPNNENIKLSLAMRIQASALVAQANQMLVNVQLWHLAERAEDVKRADMEFVDARNSARELKRQLDAIMEKLGGW